jgi:hypothetical protein
MRCFIFIILLYASSAFPCDDPQLRTAVIGGDLLQATALRASGEPIRFAKVRLYIGDKLTWTGATDRDGAFTISGLRSGRYKLSVGGWGDATVELNPKLGELSNHQRPSYTLRLFGHGCIAVTVVVN